MDARNFTISSVFSHGGNIHYILPYFQREYTWEEKQWETLINDLFDIYRDYQPEKALEHFLGSIVVISDGTRNGTIPALRLVDGQQRIITISLILCVLRDITKASDPDFASKVDAMLINNHEKGEMYFKVFPSTKYGDRDTYIAIINSNKVNIDDSRIAKAYEYFRRGIEEAVSNNEISPKLLYQVLMNCFQVVFISLDRQNESPYKIFESLNAKGKPLSQGDLVRNYIAMKLPTELQETIFKKDWAKIEDLLREQDKIGKVGELTAFLRHYLAMQRNILYSEEHIYARFRSYIEQEHPTDEAFTKEIGTISKFAKYYNKLLRPENEEDKDLRIALVRLQTMETSTAYPMLLAAYNAYSSNEISRADFICLLKMLENYMVRRYICAERTNNMNKWFPTVWPEIMQKSKEAPFIIACQKVLASNHYPQDRQIRQAIPEIKLYSRYGQHRLKIALILETIEHSLWSGTDVTVKLNNNATIEHIMPQLLTSEWKAYLGKNWQQIHEDYLHTLGNLTLVTQVKNGQLSNSQFARKKDILMSQGLRLNKYFSKNITRWDDKAIRSRSEWLGQKIIEIWPSLADMTDS